MKKLIAASFAFIAMIVVNAYAATHTIDGIEWTYTIRNGEAILGERGGDTDFSWCHPAVPLDTEGEIIIPEALPDPDTEEEVPVTYIPGSAFCSESIDHTGGDLDSRTSCTNITSITIPNSVTSIGDYAFRYCSGLISITIPDSVTSIGEEAFYECSGLISVTLPDSVTSIGVNAFSDCSSLTSVTIGNSVTSIEAGAFSDCSSLISITIPDSVTSIGRNAFSGCDSSLFDTETIPGVKLVDGWVVDFTDECPSVLDLSGTRGIADFAFSGCSSLTSVTIPDSVTSIGDSAFWECGLTSVTIPDSVTSIEAGAFSYCSSLTSITIPDSVTSIGSYAFSWCSSLTSVTIPDSVTSIGEEAFSGCDSSLFDTKTIPGVKLVDGWVVDFTEKGASKVDLTEVRGIAEGVSFSSCKGLTSVTLGNCVTSIGSYAFSWCSSLTSVTIPDSVTSIGSYAFYKCNGLTSITIPNSVTNIGDYAFSGCYKLSSIVIGSGVEHIGYKAFAGCKNLADAVFLGNAPKIDDEEYDEWNGWTSFSPFEDTPRAFVIKVKRGSYGWDGNPDSKVLPRVWYGCELEVLTTKVVFYANGGKGKMSSQKVTYGKSAKLRKNTFTRSGYVFLGWAKSKNGAVAYKNRASVKTLFSTSGKVKLYAVWAKKSYKVAFYANGGKGKMSSQKMTYGKAAKLRKNAFTRSGYVFLGWAKSKSNAKKYKVAYKNRKAVKNLTKTGKTIKLYAVWAKKSYKVAFYANGGMGKMSSQKMTYNKAAKLRKNAFKRYGYTFRGWAKSKTLAKNGKVAYKNRKAVKNLTKNGKTVKLYAVWKRK